MAVWGMGVPACFSGAGYLSEHGLNTGATTKGRICSPFSGMLLSANLLFAIEDKVFDKKVEMVSFKLGEELRKMFFCLVTSVGQRKNSESPLGIEPQTFAFALRCSTTEPQRLFSERGLLQSSNDTRPAYC